MHLPRSKVEASQFVPKVKLSLPESKVKASRHGPKGWIRVIMGLGSSQVDRIEELS